MRVQTLAQILVQGFTVGSMVEGREPFWYRVTSLTRKHHPVGPYSRTISRVLGGS